MGWIRGQERQGWEAAQKDKGRHDSVCRPSANSTLTTSIQIHVTGIVQILPVSAFHIFIIGFFC